MGNGESSEKGVRVFSSLVPPRLSVPKPKHHGEWTPGGPGKDGSRPSRRRQMLEPADGQDVPVALEPESWSSQSAEELQSFFQDHGSEERGLCH